MAERLKINGGNLRQGHASLVAAKDFFELLSGDAGEAADACGHAGMAGELRSAANNWSIRRGKLAEALGNLAGHLDNAINTFGNVDDELARMMTGEDKAAHAPSTTASSDSPFHDSGVSPGASPAPEGQAGPAVGGSGTASVTGWGAGSTTAEPVDAASIRSDEAAGGGHAVGHAPVSGAVPVGTRPEAEPAHEGSHSLGTPPILDGPGPWAPQRSGLSDASFDDLLHGLVTKWLTLGGTEKALIAALAGSGLAALILGSNKAGSKHDPHQTLGTAVGPAPLLDPDVPSGRETGPLIDVVEEPAADETPAVRPADNGLDEFLGEVGDHPEEPGGPAALPGQAEAPGGVQTGAAVGAVPAEDGMNAQVADMPSLSEAGPESHSTRPGPEMAPMPSLEHDVVPAAVQFSASASATAPDLTASPPSAATPGLVPLPSLDREGGEPAIAAAAAPLGVAALKQAGPGPVAAVGAPLPSLAIAGDASGGPGPAPQAHSRSHGHERDARKILEDLESHTRKDGE